MPRQSGINVQNSFIKGLITEATGLNFPENAATDTDNCVFSLTGLVERRLGFDFESNYSSFSSSVDSKVVVVYPWKHVAGQGDITFIVVQIGNTLHFYKVSGTTALSANKHATTIDLTTYLISGLSTVASIECQFASGNGDLFVTNSNLESFYVSYNVSTNAISATQITLQTRDFDGDSTDNSATDDTRPITDYAGLNAAHSYNLRNQSWDTTTLQAWDTARTDMPSNCDVNWYFKNASNAFDFTTVIDFAIGNSHAPKGHYVWNLYNQDRNSIVGGATTVTIASRVSTCAFFDGRVFYSGLNYTNYGGNIFFSQIIENQTQYGKCFQVNDPTSELIFDLLPTDGGVIKIPAAGVIYKMFPVFNYLLVFASTGIWAISGSTGTGFAANDYTVQKVSSVTSISSTSFVDVEGVPFWWNLEGIYTMTFDPQQNTIRVVPISRQTIDTFYGSIPVSSKKYGRGTYDPLEKVITWIYRQGSVTSFADNYTFDSVLRYNTLTQAFYKWSVSDTNVQIKGLTDIVGFAGELTAVNVVDSAVLVTDSAVQVIDFEAETELSSGLSSTIKYFIAYTAAGGGAKVSWAEVRDADYVDWQSFDTVGETYSSYFVTGYSVRGQAIQKVQLNYINVISDATEDSSYKIRGVWDYGTQGSSGSWSTNQVINIDGNFTYTNNKIKIRGRGYTYQFRVESNSTDPFHIIGWSTMTMVNQLP